MDLWECILVDNFWFSLKIRLLVCLLFWIELFCLELRQDWCNNFSPISPFVFCLTYRASKEIFSWQSQKSPCINCTGHAQKNGTVLIVFTIKTAPFFCVCPVFNGGLKASAFVLCRLFYHLWFGRQSLWDLHSCGDITQRRVVIV
jgi:hypothetical protein